MVDDIRQKARRRREPLRLAGAELERALASPAGTGVVWHRRVQQCLRDVGSALEDHVREVEDSGGLVDQIAEDAPRLVNAMRRLADEHGPLRATVAALAASAARAEDESLGEQHAATMRRDALVLLGELAEHRQRGADLLYEAYHVDIGGE